MSSMKKRTRGMTLLEILLVLTLAGLVIQGVYQFWTTSSRYTRQLENRFGQLMEAQISIAELTDSVRTARRLSFPPPGGGDRSGFCITDREGRTLLYEHERPVEREPGSIVCTDLMTGERRVVMTHVTKFVCRVPPVPRGRDPSLVHLTVSVAGDGGRHQHLVTSARLRPLDVCCPLNR